MAQAEILSSDLNNAITRLSKLPSYSTVVGVSTGEIIKTAPISRITAAINNLEAAYSSNCCESDHCQTCQTSKCQSCQNTCTCQSDKNCTNCSYSCQSSGQCTTVCQSCQSSKCESCQDSCTQCSSKCESCQDTCTNCTNCKCESCQDSCTCQSNKQCKDACQTCQSAATSSNITGYFSKSLTEVNNTMSGGSTGSTATFTSSFYYLLYYNGSRITNITTARNGGSPVGSISGTADILAYNNSARLHQTGTINGSSRDLGYFTWTLGTSLKNSSGYYIDASVKVEPAGSASSAIFTFTNHWGNASYKAYLKKSNNNYIRIFPQNGPRFRCPYNV